MNIKKIPAHILVAASSWLSRVISAAIQIVSIRIIISILGADAYAAFILLSGLIAWGALSDFGIGNSLQNYISEKKSVGKNYYPIIFCSTLFALLLMLCILVVLYFTSPYIADVYLKNFTPNQVGDKSKLFYTSMVIFCFTCFGAMLFKIWFAEQKGWLANIVSCCCTILGFLIIFVLNFIGVKINILAMLLIFFGPLAIIPSIYLFKFDISLLGKIKLNKKYVHTLLAMVAHRAKGFFIFSLMGTIALQADYLVMSQKLSAQEIVTYSVLLKIFSFVFFIYSALLQALWPVCVEYRMKKKWADLNKVVYRYITVGLSLVVLSSVSIFYFHEQVFSILAPSLKANISWILFLLFGVYFCLRVWSDTFVMLLQSMNYLKPLWYLVPIQAILSFVLQWSFADIYGIYGIVSGLILSFVLSVVIITPIMYRSRMKKLIFANK